MKHQEIIKEIVNYTAQKFKNETAEDLATIQHKSDCLRVINEILWSDFSIESSYISDVVLEVLKKENMLLDVHVEFTNSSEGKEYTESIKNIIVPFHLCIEGGSFDNFWDYLLEKVEKRLLKRYPHIDPEDIDWQDYTDGNLRWVRS